jgi:hypothetical protein
MVRLLFEILRAVQLIARAQSIGTNDAKLTLLSPRMNDRLVSREFGSTAARIEVAFARKYRIGKCETSAHCVRIRTDQQALVPELFEISR